MFLRVIRPNENKEILVNVNSIWKIEVQYAEKAPYGAGMTAGMFLNMAKGMNDPDAVRVYKIFFGNESATVSAGMDNPVMKAMEQIYMNAIKG
ncbi:MAG TPA: hypothetical protein VH682_21790 [Gemmataceae bacterium]|jgi:hypothetical protein